MSFGSYDDEIAEIPEDSFECAIHLKNNILGLTTKGGSEVEYKLARTRLLNDIQTKKLLPDFVRHSNDADSVRTTLSSVASGSGSWALRRAHVIESFKPLLTFLETGGAAADAAITSALSSYDAPLQCRQCGLKL